MGVWPGVELPSGVTGIFAAFLPDYLDPKNREFTEWVWCNFLESEFASGQLQQMPVRALGGLNKVQEAWNLLKEHKSALAHG
ncbi:hypothetical protein LTR15_004931 [Elasticomyces elasticus]|nr:hypothetical protein LTR15_004931 [Elasticomyces elasticus]